jgi:WD40 repeat protein
LRCYFTAENAQIRIWKVPADGIKNMGKNLTASVSTLKGHNHKIVSLDFHPYVNNLLLTTSGDLTAKFWDVEAESEVLSLKGFGDLVTSVTWNYDGSLLGTSCKDRQIRLFDPRSNKVVFECPDVGGTLGSKVEWLGQKDQIAVVGFDKMSERRIQLFDIKKGAQRLADFRIDSSAGVLTPIYDQGTGVLALWGKGETSVKFFEINDQQPLIHPLTEFQSTVPQLGFVILPKTLVDVREVEIFKAVKLSQDTVEPISFKVPRQRVRCLGTHHLFAMNTGTNASTFPYYRKSSSRTTSSRRPRPVSQCARSRNGWVAPPRSPSSWTCDPRICSPSLKLLR